MGFDNTTDKLITLKNRKNSIQIIVNKDIDNDKSNNCEKALNYLLSSSIKLEASLDINNITILELSHCCLTEVPQYLKQLKLKHLGLAHNKLQQVPLCLYSGLKYLESLDLSHNSISEFGMEPDCVFSLKLLKLNHNSFKDLPKWLLNFKSTNLEDFNYSCNKASHYNFKKNSFNLNVTKVKRVKLRNTDMIDSDFAFLRCFKQLEHLDISNKYYKYSNRFKDIDDLFVKQVWKQLTVLKLNDLSISFFPEGILWLESLKELSIQKNVISWFPDGIQYMVNLEVLDISNNTLVAIPKEILELQSLKVLKAARNSIDQVPDLFSMKNLSTLDLYDNLLDTLKYNLQTVEYVDLEFNYLDTVEFGDSYSEKKISYREKYGYSRMDGVQMRCEHWSRSSFTSEESGSELRIVASEDIDLEDWDAPSEVRQTSPDIDSADEDWQGDEICRVKTIVQTERVYVPDEDWMFEDADW
ncbi:unnamed protein product [Acanthoscelides obtectus]|uniref:Uncharacterized protein n=1 Tax=Acanthoscelides obtectus TaxID=200917 RepID=A0A9P0KQX1_ACAOB|nr:unnamed protein product [Acanthoscelides obtectus]CAK1631388.1 Probable serine/threonine-protein kinase roco5 [Acanthoscelides obtectus]